MKPYDENIVTFEAMFTGYVEALNRLEAAGEVRDPVATYAGLFEALNWASALDERIAAHWVPDGTGNPVRWAWRDRIPNGWIMAGVCYVRNSVHHQWSDAMLLDRGVGRDPAFWEWVWRSGDELPKRGTRRRHGPDKGRREKEDGGVYREHMEGRPVGHTLDVLGGVFLTLQRLLEPHTIRQNWTPDDYPFSVPEARSG